MSPQVTAAIIAVGGVVLTVIATVAVQISGRRATSRDTQKAFEEQRKQLDRTLGEQRIRTLNERFATAAGQLGDDKPPEVRLAGVYAMAGLADDWTENRQTCVDVLCGYLRMPYEPDPGDEAPGPGRLAFRASREVRHTVIRVITAHLQADAPVSWQGLDFDFTGVFFDGGDFSGAEFSGGLVNFRDATFTGGTVRFDGATFTGGMVDFRGAVFSGGEVYFASAVFSGGLVDFGSAVFSGGLAVFAGAEFSGSEVRFWGAVFSGGSNVSFISAKFSSGEVGFRGAVFSGGMVYFRYAVFSGGEVSFRGARFSGGHVSFDGAGFSGGTVDFRTPGDWSTPPAFPWTGTPPPGVKLPKREDQSQE
jgi:uncharacterized protein YjbI with pentapeptide repeats